MEMVLYPHSAETPLKTKRERRAPLSFLVSAVFENYGPPVPVAVVETVMSS